MTHKLEIVLLTRDRLRFLKESLDSVLAQKANFSWKVVVSDNSQADSTSRWLANHHPEIEVRRYHSISAEAHFQAAIQNATSEYLMMFHDDDILLPGCVNSLIAVLDCNTSLSSASCNAFIIRDDKLTEITMLRYARKSINIASSSQLIRRYLDFWEGGVAPLSPYIYRASALKSEYINFSKAGKYSDVIMLLNILKHGPIHWVAHPLAAYRIHDASDNHNYSPHHKLLLLRTLRAEHGLKKESFLYSSAKADIYQRTFHLRPIQLFTFASILSTKRKRIVRFIALASFLRIMRSPRYSKHILTKAVARGIQQIMLSRCASKNITA